MPRRVRLPGADELFRQTGPDAVATEAAANGEAASPRRTSQPSGRPSGRERHEEKITVYCSASELLDLERARLRLRGEHGLAVDRGRIVREAVAVVLADLEAKSEHSVLVRRLADAAGSSQLAR
jgi:hypothetical protein